MYGVCLSALLVAWVFSVLYEKGSAQATKLPGALCLRNNMRINLGQWLMKTLVCLDNHPHLAGFPEDIDITRCSSTKAHAMRSPSTTSDMVPGMLPSDGGLNKRGRIYWGDVQTLFVGCVNSASVFVFNATAAWVWVTPVFTVQEHQLWRTQTRSLCLFGGLQRLLRGDV